MRALHCLSRSFYLIFVMGILSGCAYSHPKEPEIKVEGSRAVVSIPPCSDWSNSHNTNYANGTFSNFGCAHSTNLVKMIEDPKDLVAPDGTGSADIERNVGVVTQYKSGGGSTSSTESSGTTTSGGS